MDRAFMSISKARKPFRAAKKMHFATVQALIKVYSKIRSFVADVFTSTNMCPSSKK
jgi:hypothetical protein